MTTKSQLPSLQSLIRARLTAIAAIKLPATTLTIIEADVLRGCERVVLRTVTGPRVGRAVALALAPSGANGKGRKGGTPLTSSLPAPKARAGVAGLTYKPDGSQNTASTPGVSGEPQGVNA